jgi:hypothetical protein
MGRFGPLDGLIMLGLQLALCALAVYGAARLKGRALEDVAAPKPWQVFTCGLLSFVLAFAVHIALLNALKHGWPAGFENLLIKRSIVALGWGGATALAHHFTLRPRLRMAVLLSGLAGALAYLSFTFWRA